MLPDFEDHNQETVLFVYSQLKMSSIAYKQTAVYLFHKETVKQNETRAFLDFLRWKKSHRFTYKIPYVHRIDNMSVSSIEQIGNLFISFLSVVTPVKEQKSFLVTAEFRMHVAIATPERISRSSTTARGRCISIS